MQDRERVAQLVHRYLERRFCGELVDTARFDRDNGKLGGLLPALKEAELVHQAYLGRMITDYRLIGLIGRGGFGEVYLAKHRKLNIEFDRALKIVSRSQFTELTGIEEFKRKINDTSHLVPVEQIGEAGDHFFWYTMPLADNLSGKRNAYRAKTVASCLSMASQENKGLPLGDVYAIGIAIASGLQHLHERGLVHRDVKPGNTICVGNRWLLGDVGLLAGANKNLDLSGTQVYWPPEGPMNDLKRADLYALGLTLYEAVTGKDVTRARKDLGERAFSSIPKPVQPLWRILTRACAENPAERFGSATEFRSALELEVPKMRAPVHSQGRLRRFLQSVFSRR